MIPFIHLGPILVPTFGLMIAAAMVAAYYVLRADMARRGLAAKNTTTAEMFVAVPALVGIMGAKLYHVLETPRELFADPIGQIFSRYGLAWFGGLIAGFAAFVWLARRHNFPLLEVFDAGSTAAALGYGIGRIGCLLSGDGDYGVPTSLPWGMSFPNGLVPTTDRVHPTPIYELIAACAIAWVLWRLGTDQLTARRADGFVAARQRIRNVSDPYGPGAISGRVHPHQSPVVPRHDERAGGERPVRDCGGCAVVASGEEGRATRVTFGRRGVGRRGLRPVRHRDRATTSTASRAMVSSRMGNTCQAL